MSVGHLIPAIKMLSVQILEARSHVNVMVVLLVMDLFAKVSVPRMYPIMQFIASIIFAINVFFQAY